MTLPLALQLTLTPNCSGPSFAVYVSAKTVPKKEMKERPHSMPMTQCVFSEAVRWNDHWNRARPEMERENENENGNEPLLQIQTAD